MKYLIDASALVRILRRQVDPRWEELVRRGVVAVCEPAIIETLATVAAREYQRTEDRLRDAYLPVPLPDNSWDIVASVRRELAKHSVHQGVSVADHLVVATAIRLKLTVLHEDGDFETVVRHIPQLKQARVSVPPAE